jgi:hypothetical protein
MKRLRIFRGRTYNALLALNRWLTEDDDRNTYFVCALVFVAALTLGISQKKFETPSMYAIHSATRG